MNSRCTKFLFAFFMLLNFSVLSVSAQDLINVEVRNNEFDPASITINVGDTVRWTNVEGFHNVNATTATFPSNPEGFGNEVGAGWTFEHVFTIAGDYNYQCDPHASLGMTGDITVAVSTGVSDLYTNTLIKEVYPIPAIDYTFIELNEAIITSDIDLQVVIFDINGANVYQRLVVDSNIIKVETQDWATGMYVFQLRSNEGILDSGKIVKH